VLLTRTVRHFVRCVFVLLVIVFRRLNLRVQPDHCVRVVTNANNDRVRIGSDHTYTLHPYTLYPTPHTPHPTPYTLTRVRICAGQTRKPTRRQPRTRAKASADSGGPTSKCCTTNSRAAPPHSGPLRLGCLPRARHPPPQTRRGRREGGEGEREGGWVTRPRR